jgi:SAM-dependent methyltransferase
MISVEQRARESAGASIAAVYRMVSDALDERGLAAGTLLDVGCGHGALFGELTSPAWRYVGVDVLRYPGYPSHLELVETNLDRPPVPLEDGYADVVVSAETIEHLENPRALMRELVRLTRPGGWVFVTTPNQLSFASISCLLARGQFQAFQQASGFYPAHITALLEIDLRRIATECALVDIDVTYSAVGRIPLSARSWPWPFPSRRGLRGRILSDNVLICGRKPAGLSAQAEGRFIDRGAVNTRE